ncbi:hypothetical protein Tco_0585784 [Tanacetum coccineum]
MRGVVSGLEQMDGTRCYTRGFDAPDYDSEDGISWNQVTMIKMMSKLKMMTMQIKMTLMRLLKMMVCFGFNWVILGTNGYVYFTLINKTIQEDDDEEQTESDDDGDDFVHLKLTTHDDEIIHEEDTDEDDSSISSSDEENSDNDVEGTNVEGAKMDEEATYAENQGTEEVKDTNTNIDGRDKVMTDVEDTHVTLTPVNPDGQQQSSSVSSGFVSNMLNPNQDTGVDDIFRQHTEATSLIDTSVTAIMEPSFTAQINRPPTPHPIIIHPQQQPILTPATTTSSSLQNRPKLASCVAFDHEAVDVAVQLKYERIREESSTANQQFLDSIDDGMKKSIGTRSDIQKQLYKDLVEAYEADKILLDTYGDTVTIKRPKDGADDDDEPSDEQNGGPKKKVRIRNLLHTSDSKQEFETGGPRRIQAGRRDQHLPDWFQKPTRLPSPDHAWNTSVPAIHETVQPWVGEVYKATTEKLDWINPKGRNIRMICDSHDRLVQITQAKVLYLVTKTKAADYGHIKWIEDLVPISMWSQTIVKYDRSALWGISHWGKKRRQFYAFATSRESARDVYSKRRIIAVTKVEIVEWHDYKHLDWITVRRDDDALYTFKEGDFHRLRIQDIEDMLLLLVQGKVTNLSVEERIAFNVSLRMFTRRVVIQRRVEDLQLGVESYQKKLNLTKPDTYRSNLRRQDAYTPYSDPRGFIYENKDKKNRLMRIDELHKFSDGTLDDVRSALNDRLKGIRMEYLPETFWNHRDKANARAMIQAIDKRLKTRRIMRSLERFVGGRPYGGDLRLLQRTI